MKGTKLRFISAYNLSYMFRRMCTNFRETAIQTNLHTLYICVLQGCW